MNTTVHMIHHHWGSMLFVIGANHMTDSTTVEAAARCPEFGEAVSEYWLPFKPSSYHYAPTSPNAPNTCEKSVQFVIEAEQKKRDPPLEIVGGTKSCFITTADDAIQPLQTITHPIAYEQKLQALIKN